MCSVDVPMHHNACGGQAPIGVSMCQCKTLLCSLLCPFPRRSLEVGGACVRLRLRLRLCLCVCGRSRLPEFEVIAAGFKQACSTDYNSQNKGSIWTNTNISTTPIPNVQISRLYIYIYCSQKLSIATKEQK